MKKKKQNLIFKTLNNLFISPIKEELLKEIRNLKKENYENYKNLSSETNSKELNINKEVASSQERESQTIDEKLKAFNVNPNAFNSVARSNVKDKPEQYINPLLLRNFSVDYPIARACIDYVKNVITRQDWDIVKENEEEELSNDDEIRIKLQEFFKRPYGFDSSMRIFLENIIEDYLVMGSVSIEKVRTRGGSVFNLMPVDVSTIKVRINDNGRIPNPPEIAYEQWVMGFKVAELTKDDLIFRVKNARPNTIFGLSPLESLIIQVQSALAGSLYNYKFFTDSNLVEGFVEVPEDWNKDQIQEFQAYFDSMISGDPRFQRRLKMMPGGMKYTPTKKPEEMQFERFELWLLQQTCAVFGVTPQTLGFTNQINKATAEVQYEVTQDRVGKGLQQFIEELFTDIIQNSMGYKDYRFSFVKVMETDELEEAQIEDIKIKNGTLSVDEIRRANGLEEIGLGHFIMTGQGPQFINDLLNGEDEASNNPENNLETNAETNVEINEIEDEIGDEELERKEFVTWKKYCLNAFKRNKLESLKEFKTYHIKKEIEEEIKKNLNEVQSKEDIVLIFNDYISGDYKSVSDLKRILNELNKIKLS